MPEELFEHTTGQGKQENDSDEEIEALKFTEKMMDDKIDKDAILQAIALYHVYSSTAEDGNVVALRGDAVKTETYFTPEKDGHKYASELVDQITNLNILTLVAAWVLPMKMKKNLTIENIIIL